MDHKFDYDTRWGFETETELFRHVWDTVPHYSYVSGIPITEPSPANFAHVLSKAVNRHPHFRLNPDNILLVTREEHNLIDQGTQAARDRYCQRIRTASFGPFYKKREELEKQYEILYSDLTGIKV